MRRIQRAVLLAVLLAIGPVVAGCANFDPDSLDFFGLNEKKKLPGERKPVFPDGVPGVSQGIPSEYLKGNEAQQTGAAPDVSPPAGAENKTAAVQPAAQPKPKPKAKPKAKPKPKPRRAEQAQPARAQQQQPAPWPEPQPQQQPAQQSPWPSPNQSSSPAPWPAAPAPGTFSR